MRFCPYAQRAHLVLDAKRIAHHVVNVHLKQKPEWLTDYSRLGKVPALGLTNEPGRPYIHESLLIADYLDEKYAQRPLYPADPLAKVNERLWIERFSSVITLFYRILTSADEQTVPAHLAELEQALAVFEVELVRRGTRFFGSDELPGMLDYMIWPWFERIAGLRRGALEFKFTAERFPALVKFYAEMQKDEAVKVSFLSGDVHREYRTGQVAGNPNYELLNKLLDRNTPGRS